MNKYYWATHFTREGKSYQVLAPKDYEMRIPQAHIDSTFYVYTSMEDAEKGVPAGGSGFFVGISSGEENRYLAYAVTNVHVIAHCSEYPVIRANKKGGGFVLLETNKSEWQSHPSGDDISVCHLRGVANLGLDIGIVHPTEFVTETNLKRDNLNIGPGDDTYMIGRFTNHEGSTTNTPIVRYGNISLNPDKNHTVFNPETKHQDEVFLIEARSLSGYSGSAVFTYINEFDYRDKPLEITAETNLIPKPYFLGVNIGHTRMMMPVQAEKPPRLTDYIDVKVKGIGKLYSEYNSGIMRIAPAWKLQEMLDMGVFAEMREKAKKQLEEKKRKAFTLDNLPEEVKESINISKEDFEKDLRKVTSKTKPSQPDKPKSERK
ncbi:MAG TPA: hypothetical protein VLF90_00235 [Patescibacteria group bacterium]|nr:hypothetical protein [Patescibacteria group bacterium]